jgi:hypothetical protein
MEKRKHMKLIQLLSFATLLIAPFVFEGLTLPAFSADRSDGHALALSHRYGAYTHRGNIAAGQTLVIDTPEGSITCTGGVNREYTGMKGPEGDLKHTSGGRTCRFN